MKKFSLFILIVCVFMQCLGVGGCGTSPLEKLAAPSGFALSGNTVTWAEVKNAVGYAVEFQSKETETAEPRFALPDGLEAGDYTIEVMAIGDYETCDSEWATFSFTLESSADGGGNNEPIVKQDYDSIGLLYTFFPTGAGMKSGAARRTLRELSPSPKHFTDCPLKKSRTTVLRAIPGKRIRS